MLSDRWRDRVATAVDWLGLILSGLGVAVCLLAARGRDRAPARPPFAAALARAHPYLLWGSLALLALVTGVNTARDLGPDFFYQRGWDAFERQDYYRAIRNFDRARRLGGRSNRAGDAAFFHAASLFRQNRYEEARAGYQEVADRYPTSIWVAESHYHVGLCLERLEQWQPARERYRLGR